MQGTWFDNPDCLTPALPRTPEELEIEAASLPLGRCLIVTRDEFRAIAKRVSLAWRFAGRRIAVVGR